MDFDADKTVSYWLEGAAYDLGVAEAMLSAEKYPYALFMGHLAVEKSLKALVVKTTHQHAPHTHSLPILASKLTEELPEDVTAALVRFMEFYIESRYINTNSFIKNAQENLQNRISMRSKGYSHG